MEKDSKFPKYFCPMAWNGLFIGASQEYRPCCKFSRSLLDASGPLTFPSTQPDETWDTHNRVMLQKQILNNEKPKECIACWREEAGGRLSLRKAVIQCMTEVDNFEDFLEHEKTNKSLFVTLGNKCNLKCRICGPHSSSLWEKEMSEHEKIPFEQSKQKNARVASLVESLKHTAHKANYIELVGGETFLSKDFFSFIDYLNDEGLSKNLELKCVSNGTIFPENRLHHFEKFKRFVICLSIDDIYERFNYQRYPANWENVQENLFKFSNWVNSQPNLTLEIICTISIFNIYHICETLIWFQDQNFNPYFNLVHYPNHFSVIYLDKNTKKKILRKLLLDIDKYGEKLNAISRSKMYKLLSLLKVHGDSEQTNALKTEIQKIDKYREQSFRSIYPEYSKIILES